MKREPAPTAAGPTWFGQPAGLTILFLTQMWEIFSYYGMRALLVYYMTKQLLIGQQQASLIYGAYTATAYFTPILGGMLADGRLGKRRAVIIGAAVMALGHFMMAFEPMFYPALATIALGNGLFLPSLPSQINDLYGPGDPRRDSAYNVYYVGINIGGFLAPLVCGSLGEVYGWHWGFAAAGIGMLAGLAIYTFGGKYLPAPRVAAPVPVIPSAQAADSRRTLFVLLAVGFAVTIFRGAYEQIGNTVALWADSGIDRGLGSWVVPMTWFQSINPLLVFLMTPVLLAYWRWRSRRARAAMPLRRMAAGALIVAAAYVLLAAVAGATAGERASWVWLVLFFAVFTLGELYILPTGLGLFARLAPPRQGATTVAAWFFAIFTGSMMAGVVGAWWSEMSHVQFFGVLSMLAAVAAAILLVLSHAVRRLQASGGGGVSLDSSLEVQDASLARQELGRTDDHRGDREPAGASGQRPFPARSRAAQRDDLRRIGR